MNKVENKIQIGQLTQSAVQAFLVGEIQIKKWYEALFPWKSGILCCLLH